MMVKKDTLCHDAASQTSNRILIIIIKFCLDIDG